MDAGAFAFVMATGIVSVAAQLQRLPTLSDVLFAIATLSWLALTAVMVARAIRHRTGRPKLESFAFVAATAVLGARFAFAGRDVVALALWATAVGAWLALLLRRPQLKSATGGWFLIVVSTESLAVLASLIRARLDADLLPVGLAYWAIGLALYLPVAAAIALALRDRRRFTPDLWITMGALAIATLAGTELLEAARATQTLGWVRASLRNADLATWALASACIPPLAVVEARNRAGWRYEFGRWSFVFPLGMYAVATQTLGRAIQLRPLDELAHVFFAIALIAWVMTTTGLSRLVFAAK